MPIRAVFMPGQTEITVNGFHQWDYGQQLEIRASDLPGEVEVHFACVGMKEAAVRICAMVNGVGTVAVPDACLEQTAPFKAWIYEVDGTTGTTAKTITLNVVPRAKPQKSDDVPEEFYNQYTEALAEFNKHVESLKDGSVVVAKAVEADRAESAASADTASTAGHAGTAGHAETAGLADTAGTATKADYPTSGGYFITGKSFCGSTYTTAPWDSVFNHGVYMFIENGSTLILDSRAEYSPIYYKEYLGALIPHRLAVIRGDAEFAIRRQGLYNGVWMQFDGGAEATDNLMYVGIDYSPAG